MNRSKLFSFVAGVMTLVVFAQALGFPNLKSNQRVKVVTRDGGYVQIYMNSATGSLEISDCDNDMNCILSVSLGERQIEQLKLKLAKYDRQTLRTIVLGVGSMGSGVAGVILGIVEVWFYPALLVAAFVGVPAMWIKAAWEGRGGRFEASMIRFQIEQNSGKEEIVISTEYTRENLMEKLTEFAKINSAN